MQLPQQSCGLAKKGAAFGRNVEPIALITIREIHYLEQTLGEAFCGKYCFARQPHIRVKALDGCMNQEDGPPCDRTFGAGVVLCSEGSEASQVNV
ncbi:hypothetical protein [Bradyrhizobium sp. Arg816]|uniref:hypothetical protein n=1 Tax=Bradyrhizobium sp. Arg816 TaxID=2998491 RepID=UPI00249EDE1F|nr:hypothetical protein [Bradyrhizobium sp. Arg816]MDI3566940.1 hypothetical protein [Bradyrhizobium sp. Arg816]